MAKGNNDYRTAQGKEKRSLLIHFRFLGAQKSSFLPVWNKDVRVLQKFIRKSL